MKKIKAFTIVELTVALLISAIIISFSYYALLFFNRQLSLYRKKSADTTELLLLKKAFQLDFEQAKTVEDSAGTKLWMKLKETEVKYEWGNNGIVRNTNDKIDSFPLSNFEATITKLNDTISLVQKVVFRLRLGNIPVETAFTKYYSATELMGAEKRY